VSAKCFQHLAPKQLPRFRHGDARGRPKVRGRTHTVCDKKRLLVFIPENPRARVVLLEIGRRKDWAHIPLPKVNLVQVVSLYRSCHQHGCKRGVDLIVAGPVLVLGILGRLPGRLPVEDELG